jgi:hypothetical protein
MMVFDLDPMAIAPFTRRIAGRLQQPSMPEPQQGSLSEQDRLSEQGSLSEQASPRCLVLLPPCKTQSPDKGSGPEVVEMRS